MKKVKIYINSLLLICFLFCSFTLETELLENFYSSYKVDENIENIITHYKNELKKEASKTNIIKFMKYSIILSNYALINEDYKQVLIDNDKLLNKFIKFFNNDAEVLNIYLDYLWSFLSWNKENSFEVLNKIPYTSRRICEIDKNNIEAKLKLAMWYCSATSYNTSLWNAFILEQEDNIKKMNKTLQFNAYIQYSIFYMKKNNVKKAFNYLYKAEEIYPESITPILIKENFNNGKYGW